MIVASGTGERMKSAIPKQFIELKGLPILFHTIRAFSEAVKDIEIVVVLAESFQEFYLELCQKHQFEIEVTIVSGGATRSASVFNGIKACRAEVVAIHDGVRPLVSARSIQDGFRLTEELGNATLAVSVKDSVRRIEGQNNSAIDRASLKLIQTPQTFRRQEILAAFEKCGLNNPTDDATVFEMAGGRVNLIEGDYTNIKITTPEDLLFAEAILRSKA